MRDEVFSRFQTLLKRVESDIPEGYDVYIYSLTELATYKSTFLKALMGLCEESGLWMDLHDPEWEQIFECIQSQRETPVTTRCLELSRQFFRFKRARLYQPVLRQLPPPISEFSEALNSLILELRGQT